MPYLIGLFIIIALVFSASDGDGLLGNLMNPVKGVNDLKNKITGTIFPKTEQELLIDNIRNDYQELDKFFSNSASNISGAKGVSAEDKESIKKASEAFKKSKELISNLEKLEKQDKSLVKEIIEKVLDLDDKKSPPADGLEPTYIPPQCKLVCPSL